MNSRQTTNFLVGNLRQVVCQLTSESAITKQKSTFNNKDGSKKTRLDENLSKKVVIGLIEIFNFSGKNGIYSPKMSK